MFAAVVLVGLLVGWLAGSSGNAVAGPGDQAPDFSVELIDGGTFQLSSHLEGDGRPLVLNLWASWCVPCRVEIPEISTFSLERADVVVLGVAVEDSESSARAFADEIDASYPLALGTAAFEDAYPAPGLPVTYVIGSSGRVERVFNGIVDREVLAELVAG